jgi:hypothetical protein
MNIPQQLELRFRHSIGSVTVETPSVIETDIIICPSSTWSADPRACDPSWSTVTVDDGDERLTIATQLTLPTSVIDAGPGFHRSSLGR